MNVLNHRILHIIYAGLYVFLLLVIRVAQLQLIEGNYWQKRAEHNITHHEVIAPRRGIIYDSNGIVLVANKPVQQVVWVGSGKRQLTSFQKDAIQKLLFLIGKNDQSLSIITQIARSERCYQPFILVDHLSFELLSSIAEQFPATHKNIKIIERTERYYPHGNIACHLLGHMQTYMQQIGKMGIEGLVEIVLRGNQGVTLNTITAQGKKIHQEELVHVQNGADVITTLDINLQKICEQTFPQEYVGAVILMDPCEGNILALVSRPGFDPSLFTKPISAEDWSHLHIQSPFLNRALCALYPPGSIFKLVSASTMLEEKFISSNAKIVCHGNIQYGTRLYWCHKREGHGIIDSLNQAVALSCNIPFFEVAKQMNVDVLATYAHIFGLGDKTGILLPEQEGIIPTKEWKLSVKNEPWQQGETLSVIIGQSFVLVTPIQIARMISSIFTGYLVKPRILKNEPVVTNTLCLSENTQLFLQESMKAVVKQGTGKHLNTVPEMSIYAKTSTAQTSDLTKRKFGQAFMEHGWFVCYFSYKNNRPITLVILVEHAGTSAVATKIAKQFLTEYKKMCDVMRQS